MPEEVKKCPLCGSKQHQVFDRRVFKGHQVINRLCERCGLVFQSPRMTEEEAAVFYAAEYRRLYQGTDAPVIKDLLVQRARAQALTDFLKKYIDEIHRFLDVGASAGELLLYVRKEYGAEVVGVEPGEAYRNHASQYRLKMYPSLDALLHDEQEPFTVVALSHVLEHLPDPVNYLSHLRKTVLHQNGWLLVEVPNLYGHQSFEVAHNFSFSPHTLRQTLYAAGYRVEVLEAHGRPRSGVIPLYITVLAQPDVRYAQKNIQGERRVALKRRLAMLHRKVMLRLFPLQAWKEI